jgi:hypothetical protein
VVGDGLALEEDRHDGGLAGATSDDALLGSEKGVDVVEIRGGPHGEIDELLPLRREVSVGPQGGDQLGAKRQHRLRAHGATVERREPAEPNASFGSREPMPGVGAAHRLQA